MTFCFFSLLTASIIHDMDDMNLGISADNFFQMGAALVHYYVRTAFNIMETEIFFIHVRMKAGE